MHHTTHDVLGRAAYLRRTCEILLRQLEQIDTSLTGTERLTPIQEAAVSDANVSHAERAAEHLDLASQYVDSWGRALGTSLTTEPSWLRR